MNIEIKIWKLVLAVSLFKWHRIRFLNESYYDGGGFSFCAGPIIVDWIRFENTSYIR